MGRTQGLEILMNERIKELAEQAGYHPDVFEMCKPGMEKFAELIVKECATIADRNSHLSYPDHGIKIKRHFGVD
jgi:hypothetical protein